MVLIKLLLAALAFCTCLPLHFYVAGTEDHESVNYHREQSNLTGVKFAIQDFNFHFCQKILFICFILSSKTEYCKKNFITGCKKHLSIFS